ncbi:MAG: hypothetical protein WC989_02505 [Micavibrio sp.]
MADAPLEYQIGFLLFYEIIFVLAYYKDFKTRPIFPLTRHLMFALGLLFGPLVFALTHSG